jgi:hypothetical protein
MRETCKIATCLQIDSSSARLIFIHVHFVDLRSRRTLGRRLGNFEGIVLVGVREFLNLEDLKFPIPLNEREDTGIITSHRTAVDSDHGLGLHHGQCYGPRQRDGLVWKEECGERLFLGLQSLLNNQLGVVGVSLRAQKQFSGLDTYFDLEDRGNYVPSKPLDVLLLCFLGVDGLGE